MNGSASEVDLIEESRARERAGEIGAALQCAQHALEIAREAGDPEAQATAWARIGFVQYRLGHYPEAADCAEQALALVGPHSPARADAWITLGVCAMETGTLAEAEAYFVQAADLARQINYPLARLRALHNLAAAVYVLRGQFDLALATYEEAYRLAGELGSPIQYTTLVAMTNLLLQTGQNARAQEMLERFGPPEAIPKQMRGYLLWLVGQAAMNEGDLAAALTNLSQSRAIAEELGDPALQAFVFMGYSQVQRQAGQPAAACQWADEGVNLASRAGNQRLLGRMLIERGLARWANDQLAAAEEDFRLAAQDLPKRHQQYDLARANFYLAALLHTQRKAGADAAWGQAAEQILANGYSAILDLERPRAYPLISAYLVHPDPWLAELSQRCMEFLQAATPPPLRAITLGSFVVSIGGRAAAAGSLRKRRAGELLALLLLSPGQALLFDQVCEAFWPDKDSEAAQTLFHQTTSALRRALEPDLPHKFPSRYLTVSEGQVRLRLPPGSQVDCWTFEKLVRQGEWAAAVAAYGGELLPEYRYAEWAVAPRQRLEQLFERALLRLAEQRLTEGQLEPALEASRRLLECEPWNEQAGLIAMQACLEMGDRLGAVRVYRQVAAALREEFDLEPAREMESIYRSLVTKK